MVRIYKIYITITIFRFLEARTSTSKKFNFKLKSSDQNLKLYRFTSNLYHGMFLYSICILLRMIFNYKSKSKLIINLKLHTLMIYIVFLSSSSSSSSSSLRRSSHPYSIYNVWPCLFLRGSYYGLTYDLTVLLLLYTAV